TFFWPRKSALSSAPPSSAALKIMRFRKFRVKTLVLSAPRGGANEVEDCTRRDESRFGLPHHVNAVVIAQSIFTRCYKALSFIRPHNQKIVILSLIFWFVETSKHVRVKQHFQKRVHVSPFSLEFLRHRDTNDFPRS